jgi:hypothetical protein
MGTQGNSLLLNGELAIRAMLGRVNDGEPLPARAWELAEIGKNINGVADALGSDIFRVLGLRRDGTTDVEQKLLEHALGFHAINGLISAGYVEQTSMPLAEYQKLMKDTGSLQKQEESGKLINFIRAVNETKEGESIELAGIAKETKDIFESVEDLGAKVKEVFDIDIREIRPITKPIPLNPKKGVQNSFQNLTKKAKDVVTKLQSRPWKFNKSATDAFFALLDQNEEAVLDILGYDKNTDSGLTVYKKARESKNRTILRNIKNIREFVAKAQTKEFYLPHFISVSNRIFVDGESGVNPQADKIVRFLVNV